MEDDDCFAARLAGALRRRLGERAQPLADARLGRALADRQTIKADLFLAVQVILRDEGAVFSRSRHR